jgi:nicotinate-nucleotide--dimethylbenzimidazole phosphoribosyltransferase
LVAEKLASGAKDWWLATHLSIEPAHKAALDALELEPLFDLRLRLGEGTGAVAALPWVVMATKVLAEMATFAEAGVSDKQ